MELSVQHAMQCPRFLYSLAVSVSFPSKMAAMDLCSADFPNRLSKDSGVFMGALEDADEISKASFFDCVFLFSSFTVSKAPVVTPLAISNADPANDAVAAPMAFPTCDERPRMLIALDFHTTSCCAWACRHISRFSVSRCCAKSATIFVKQSPQKG